MNKLSHIDIWRRSIRLLVILLGWQLSMLAIAVEPARPADADRVQQRMQVLIDYLDSPEYAAMVSWDEHVVLAYKRAQGRMPKPLEMFTIDALRKDIGLSRSDVLSLALRGKQSHPGWAQCRRFIQRIKRRDFLPDRGARDIARQLRQIPRQTLLEMLRQTRPEAQGLTDDSQTAALSASTATPYVNYTTYFGYLHAHSELSDGVGSPLQAYDFARFSDELDFFALTDHGELLIIWPWNNKWAKLLAAANATNVPEVFVSLWGFEWSNPFLGHVNVLNSTDFTHALLTFWLSDFYNWMAARPQSFGRFNHPGEYDDLGLEFYHFMPYAPVRSQLVGIETWNGNDSFDVYHYAGGYSSAYGYLDEANRKGWWLGALGGQDNHAGAWGTSNHFRTAVLATALTREAIIEAYTQRRFYATEDKDLELDVRVLGFPMGSRLSGVARAFDVSACDGSGDSFREIRLYRNGDLISSQSVSGTCFNVSMSDTDYTSPAYYYVIVQQNDDNDGNGRNDEAMSSSIWID